jgi:hypothetical protein
VSVIACFRQLSLSPTETLRQKLGLEPSMNSFSLGAQVGGRSAKEATAQEQELRDMFSRWTGDYSSAVREFAFILRIDGEFHSYTEMWSICGAQKAKRKRDWIEVEIGIPERWWRLAHSDGYKKRLAGEVEKGFISMIEVLRRNRGIVNAEALMNDWKRIKGHYLAPKTRLQ